MLQLTLDGQPATLKQGTAFKITRENPAFSKQGDYSFEISLPLASCPENLAILGPVRRPEGFSPQERLGGQFHLIAPPLSLHGTYRVTELGNTEAKIQLLAARTEANYAATDASGNDLYVDELDLGRCWDEEWPAMADEVHENYPGEEFTYDYPTLFQAAWYFSYCRTPLADRLAHGAAGQTTCCLFPVAPAAAEAFGGGVFAGANYHKLSSLTTDPQFWPDFRPAIAGGASVKISERLCPQPMLCDVLRRVCRAVGFRLNVEAFSSFSRNLIIVSSRFSVQIAELLPHWTVKEFFAEVENLLGIVLVFGEDGTATPVPRDEYYSGKIQPLTQVLDDFSADCEEEAQEETSATGNVDYEWPASDDMLRLPDEVWQRADVRRMASLADIDSFIAGLSNDERTDSAYLFVSQAENTAYAILENLSGEWVRTRLDHYPPLLRDASTREIGTKLRIVPARMRAVQWNNGELGGMPDYPLLLSAAEFSKEAYFSVNSAVNPDSPTAGEQEAEADKPDVMEIAFGGAGDWGYLFQNAAAGVDAFFSAPLAVTVQKDEKTGLPAYIAMENRGQEFQFPPEGPFPLPRLLGGTAGSWNRSGAAQGAAFEIDTNTAYEFDFISPGPIDVRRAFLIAGRVYVAKKLEYSFNAERTDPLVHGTFYLVS